MKKGEMITEGDENRHCPLCNTPCEVKLAEDWRSASIRCPECCHIEMGKDLDATWQAFKAWAAAQQPSDPSVAQKIEWECNRVCNMLLEKNKSYGNSALDPVRIFSKADPVEQLKVRIDDKLSRLIRGSEAANEDTELDLIGYLILLRVARNKS